MFRRIFAAVVAIALANFFAVPPALASEPPQGSYLQSCSGVTANGSFITAQQCKNRAGSYRYGQVFDSSGCVGDIANIDGTITCPKGSEAAPAGSYRATCVQIEAKFGTLYARCKTIHSIDDLSTWRYTSLANYHACHNDVVNRNGVLTCG